MFHYHTEQLEKWNTATTMFHYLTGQLEKWNTISPNVALSHRAIGKVKHNKPQCSTIRQTPSKAIDVTK